MPAMTLIPIWALFHDGWIVAYKMQLRTDIRQLRGQQVSLASKAYVTRKNIQVIISGVRRSLK